MRRKENYEPEGTRPLSGVAAECLLRKLAAFEKGTELIKINGQNMQLYTK